MADIDIDVVDGIGQDATMQLDRRLHPSALRITTAADIVFGINGINGRLRANRLRRLRIFGHASAGVQGLGNSETTQIPDQLLQTDANGKLLRPELLAMLRSSFSPDGWVELHGCSVARGWAGKMLLTQLSQLWGVPVRGGIEDQDEHPGFEGPQRTARPAPGGGMQFR